MMSLLHRQNLGSLRGAVPLAAAVIGGKALSTVVGGREVYRDAGYHDK
ncbi:hypothetical protein [Bradyrhizobium sp. USDA 3650]